MVEHCDNQGDKTHPMEGFDIYRMATEFHRIYEEESKLQGWKTQKRCQVEFSKLPMKNQIVMQRTCARLTDWLNKNKERI
jgi:hypothetical protein